MWVLHFWETVHAPEGIEALKPLVEAGLKAWDFPLPSPGFVDDMFHSPRFHQRIVKALKEFADTAREPLTLPDASAARRQQPAQSTPLPAGPADAPTTGPTGMPTASAPAAGAPKRRGPGPAP